MVRSASLGDGGLFLAVKQEEQKESLLSFASCGSPRPGSKGATGFLFPLSESTEKWRWGMVEADKGSWNILSFIFGRDRLKPWIIPDKFPINRNMDGPSASAPIFCFLYFLRLTAAGGQGHIIPSPISLLIFSSDG